MTASRDARTVVSLAASSVEPEFAPPQHFRRTQKAAWADLVARTDRDLHSSQNVITFEMAATLLAKFRSGKALLATEQKQLNGLLAVLGVATAGGVALRPQRSNDAYFDK
jgi:hypothetical protein